MLGEEGSDVRGKKASRMCRVGHLGPLRVLLKVYLKGPLVALMVPFWATRAVSCKVLRLRISLTPVVGCPGS